jgi:capsid assembly protease
MDREFLAAMAGCSAWALDHGHIHSVQALIASAAKRLASGEQRTATTEQRENVRTVAKAIAVIPVVGVVISRGFSWMSDYGLCASDMIGATFDAALNDDRVKSIVLDVDSPGGMAVGTPELAAKIYAARGRKPIIAVANHIAASAAYWIPAAADRLYVTPSGCAGSIGVYSVHMELSKLYEDMGVKVEVVKAGKHKAEGNPWQPLGDEARQHMQEVVDTIHSDFLRGVAKYRNKPVAEVAETFGQGRCLDARDAVRVGMADGIATFEQVIARLHAGKIVTSGPASSDDWSTPVACIDQQEASARHRVAKMRVAVKG